MGRMQLTDIDAGGTIDAGIDPADEEGRDVSRKACRHRKCQMEESADKKVQEENGTAAVAIDKKATTRIAEEAANRLHQLEGDGVGERYPTLGQNCRQHEQNAVRRPQKPE